MSSLELGVTRIDQYFLVVPGESRTHHCSLQVCRKTELGPEDCRTPLCPLARTMALVCTGAVAWALGDTEAGACTNH